MIKYLGAVALLLAGSLAVAGEVEDKIKSKVQSAFGVQVSDVRESAIKNVYEVMVGNQIVYMDAGGDYMIQGHMFDLNTRTDLTDQRLSGMRMKALNDMGEDQMVIYGPKGPAKYEMTVFTDSTCGYCRKLHKEVDELVKNGVKVRFLLYPRAGKGSPAYNTLVSVWCSDDRKKYLDMAEAGQAVPAKTCENPVDQHIALGAEFGVRGTPYIVTGNGTAIPGYRPAKELLPILMQDTVQ